jgi:hypothetical protein
MIYANWLSKPVVTKAGEDTAWYFQVRDGDGVVVDITGWTFGFWAVDQMDATNIITISSGSFTIVTPSSGIAYFVVSRSVTTSQGGKAFQGSLWRTNSGAQKELASGAWKVSRTSRP